MSNVKDPFQILADELTLIRKDMDQLQRTSLDKDDAQVLHEILAEGVDRMYKVGPQVEEAIENRLLVVAAHLKEETAKAAAKAAKDAIRSAHDESIDAARNLIQAAGEARREAWRYFGGFWVWLGCVAAVAAFCGALVMFWLQGRADAHAFGDHPGIFCTSAGGQVVDNQGGGKFCAFWIERPKQQNGK